MSLKRLLSARAAAVASVAVTLARGHVGTLLVAALVMAGAAVAGALWEGARPELVKLGRDLTIGVLDRLRHLRP